MEALRFDAEQHRYFVGERELPSVTTVLRMLDRFERVPPAVLEAAREFGQHVHLACELDNQGVLDEDSLDIALLPYLQGWRRFRAESGFVILGSEQRVVHHKLGYAGTLDVIGTLCIGALAVLDIKSGILPRTVGYQTAAYAEAYGAQHGKKPMRRYCLQLNPEFPNGYKLHRLTKTTDYNMFVSCLNVWRDMNAD
jgi:hypothetical protein